LSDEKQNQPVNPHLYHYSRLLGYRFSQLSLKYFLIADYPFYISRKTLFCLLLVLLGISYPLTITETESFWKLKKNNDEIKESNERYDIVVLPATLSGTGKFRKMIFWSNGIKKFSDTKTSGWRQFKMVVW
jgi:hypothetical protein